ncbi:phosphotransferase family protein [Metarhizium guizhouense ARSEF 977]|uniref:Phosphotransferase family protein n=1 Tax=Metarhizium guizhouense (strain ARSEF 977) TaxID=1276136 RepID=A0A0B4HJ52_METGA|nr:phosphotransferase family protein [Metarhizium guizhouense ARSEF 977]
MWMQGDDVAWEESDRIEREWRESLLTTSTMLAIGNFVAKHRQGVPQEIGPLKAGAFNALFRLTYLDGGSAVIRFAKPGRTMFPEEKIRSESATIRYIQDHKYTARQLFQKLARERKLVSDRYDKGPFKFWCDDIRPSNILLDANLQIVAVIDWEFSYAAPSEFTFAPPWWLLIEQPEYWEKGRLEDWIQQYERRLATFLKAMVDCEDASIAAGQLLEEQRLSGKMRESWAGGDFWTVYAARRNFAFDGVFWEKLDPRFFGTGKGGSGPGDAWMERLELLDGQARAAMEAFVDRKVAESETRELAWEPDEVF